MTPIKAVGFYKKVAEFLLPGTYPECGGYTPPPSSTPKSPPPSESTEAAVIEEESKEEPEVFSEEMSESLVVTVARHLIREDELTIRRLQTERSHLDARIAELSKKRARLVRFLDEIQD